MCLHRVAAEIRQLPSVERVMNAELMPLAASPAGTPDNANGDGYLTRLMVGSQMSRPACELLAGVNQRCAGGFTSVRLVRTERVRAIQAERRCTGRNETVRQVDPELPFIVICRDAAFLEGPDSGRPAGLIVVREDACIVSLAACHDLLWSLSAVESQVSAASLPPHLKATLDELASGATDSQAAHNLHVSPRTLSRHVAQLTEHLGAQNRLQAGVVATRRGLV
jgi:DNA-binding CsgD family transcriptional regulator